MSGQTRELAVVQELIELEPRYEPSPEIASELDNVVMGFIIGPSAVGKNTIIDLVVANDNEFGRVQGFTTRPREERDSPDVYRFRDGGETGLKEVLNDVKDKKLVQYSIFPRTGYVYGSEPMDYAAPYVVMDPMASSVERLRLIPFGGIVEIGLAISGAEWIARMKERPMTPEQFRDRLYEGRYSLEWLLDQSDVLWVCNRYGLAEGVADHVKKLIRGDATPERGVRRVGEQLLRTIMYELSQ